MVRIVGVQKAQSADGEFILLQNQGNMKVHLRGHIIASEAAILSADPLEGLHIFNDDVFVPAGAFVLLSSGIGEARWSKTKENQLLYTSFLGCEEPFWSAMKGGFHLLRSQHVFTERH